jgi:hypothetical protein
MARSRYGQQDKSDTAHFGTYDKRVESGGYKKTDLLEGVNSFEYTLQKGERLDIVAHRFLNEDKYWWVLALINNIDYPFGLEAGTKIRIPHDIKEVFKKIYL